ncbi:MAG TPA: RNA-guided endonuclease TnpB family protein [Terriglobales bacterium]|nr:RNA-guided endonuclease TnpB family protein [Terriglobales bacterium]
MVQYQLKLRVSKTQEKTVESWLPILGSVWNFAIRKMELNAKDRIYFSKQEFQNLLANHGEKLGIPSHRPQGVLCTAHDAGERCFKKQAGKPRLKGMRNKLTSIPFPDPIREPKGNRITLPSLGSVRFHKMELPEGKIKCGRMVKRASGWYLCLFIDAEPKSIERAVFGKIGIDAGFKNLLTTSDGEIIEPPRELEASEVRLAQAQRGHDKKLAARIQERIANQRRDRNHKLSRRLVAENILMAFSKDAIKGMARKFGKSVASSAHGQLRQMLSYKMPQSGGTYVEPDSKFSTKTCSECGSQSGPSGWAGLLVRQWECNVCGAQHDRDVNAAINTLNAAAGCAVEVAYV